jgi:hypothetical protein
MVSKGDKYYGKMILSSHIFNIVYIILFSIFGISLIKNQIIRSLNTSIQMFICILLLIKYHPFREHKLAQSDSNLIFSSAVFLFVNLGIIETLTRASKNVTNDIAKTMSKLDENDESNNEESMVDELQSYM